MLQMRTIELSKTSKKYKGLYKMMVDDEDYESLIKYKWYVSVSANTQYAFCAIKRKQVLAHQLILNNGQTNKIVDHIDRNGLNNQKSNLRFCSKSENCRNRTKRKDTSSKYLGVSFHAPLRSYRKKDGTHIKKHGTPKYYASICHNGKRLKLGGFSNELEAAKAYNQAAIKLHGSFASLNIIKEPELV